MSDKRKELLERNRNFVTLKGPRLEDMTDEQLERRAYMLEKTFDELFAEEDAKKN